MKCFPDSAPKHFGIMFHHFSSPSIESYARGTLAAKNFQNFIQSMLKKELLRSPLDFVTSIQDRSAPLNETNTRICLTFDDNLKSQLQVAVPILNKFDVKAFFFIYSGPYVNDSTLFEYERYFFARYFSSYQEANEAFIRQFIYHNNDWTYSALEKLVCEHEYLSDFTFYTISDRIFRYVRDELLDSVSYRWHVEKLMKNSDFDKSAVSELLLDAEDLIFLDRQGHTIGIHSHSHPTKMSGLDFEGQLKEYGKSKEVLEKILGKTLTSASYPNGNYNRDSLSVMQKIGIEAAFCSSISVPNLGLNSLLEIGRVDHSMVNT